MNQKGEKVLEKLNLKKIFIDFYFFQKRPWIMIRNPESGSGSALG